MRIIRIILIFISFPFISLAQDDFKVKEISETSLSFKWDNYSLNEIVLYYGNTKNLEIGSVSNENCKIQDLNPATFYYVQGMIIIGNDTIFSDIGLYSTQSKSSGKITVYFNSPVDNSIAPNANATQVNLEDTIIGYIDRAITTLDICMYNTGSALIVAAINNAESRGVQVRYIADGTTNNSQLPNLSTTIPLLERNDADIMHNKILIIDGASVLNSYVIGGSTNHTSSNLFDDPNNIVIVQDQALAAAYKIEFEEMWGSSTMAPNAINSKFGAAKSDNTPHTFNIGGTVVESYFSPSDGTTNQIVNTINSANNDIILGLLHFTRNEPGDAVINRINSGVDVKGIIESSALFGSEFNGINNAGGNLLSHLTVPYFFHHKYAIIDGLDPSSDPIVLTGSHNWTSAAETDNDENTLIIHDAIIAGEYVEEFAQQFQSLGGVGDFTFVLSINEIDKTNLISIYPNPSNGVLTIETDKLIESISVYSISGALIYTEKLPNNNLNLNLVNGIYYLRVMISSEVYSSKLIISN